jgi:hypothetical protein
LVIVVPNTNRTKSLIPNPILKKLVPKIKPFINHGNWNQLFHPSKLNTHPTPIGCNSNQPFFGGFLFQLCDAIKVATIHKDDLTKFGYILDMKIKEKSQ